MTNDQKTVGQHAKKKPQQSFISVLKRHRKLLTLFGTAILFFTFVFRDVLRENARGTRDSYESAASSFALMDKIISVSDRVRHLEVVVESQAHGYKESSYTLRKSTELRLEDLKTSIQNAKQVCERLPRSKVGPTQSALEEIQNEADKISSELDAKKLSASEPPIASELPTGFEPLASSDLKSFYDQKVQQVKYRLQPEVKKRSDEILSVLAAEAQSAAWWYSLFNACSIYLYVLGIIVTAVGQVIGKDDDDSAIGSE
jgi:hypothetical protein